MTARTQRKNPAGTHFHCDNLVLTYHKQTCLRSGLYTLGCCLKDMELFRVTATYATSLFYSKGNRNATTPLVNLSLKRSVHVPLYVASALQKPFSSPSDAAAAAMIEPYVRCCMLL